MARDGGVEGETGYPLARLSEPLILRLQVEHPGISQRPIFYYQASTENGPHQLVIDQQGNIFDTPASRRDRRQRSIVEIEGEVEVIPLDGRSVTLVPPQVLRATETQERWVRLTIGAGENTRQVVVPPDMLIDGLLKGVHIQELLGREVSQNGIIYTLVLPAPADQDQIRRHQGRRIQTEVDIPTYILVFNPHTSNSPEGINWLEDSRQMFFKFEEASAAALLSCIVDPGQRKAVSEALAKWLARSLDRKLKDIGGGEVVTSERFFTALRSAIPRSLQTQELSERHTQIPLVSRARTLQLGERRGAQIISPAVLERLETVTQRFRQAAESGFVNTSEIEEFIALHEVNLPTIHQELLYSEDSTSEQLGFSVLDGYRHFAQGLRVLVAEHNQRVEAVLRDRFYTQTIEKGLTPYEALEEAEAKVIQAEDERKRAIEGVREATKTIDDYPTGIRGLFLRKARQEAEVRHRLAISASSKATDVWVEANAERHKAASDLETTFSGVTEEMEKFFSIANPDLDWERIRKIQDQLISIRSYKETPEERILDEELKIEREKKFDPEVMTLRVIKQGISIVKEYLKNYGRRALIQGREQGDYYIGEMKEADLLSMDDQAAQRLLVLAEYITLMWRIEASSRRKDPRQKDELTALARQQFDRWPVYWIHCPRRVFIPFHFNLEWQTPTQEVGPEYGLLNAGLEGERIGRGSLERDRNANVLSAWQERRSLDEGVARAVLSSEILRGAAFLGLSDDKSSFQGGYLSKTSWIREAFLEAAKLTVEDLDPIDPEANTAALRIPNLLLPPLGMILNSLDHREVPILAMAARILIDNRGFLFADRQHCYGPLDEQRRYYIRNNDLAEVSRFLVGILKRLMPGLNQDHLEANLAHFTNSDFPSRTPDEIDRSIRKDLPVLGSV